jgi:hypothetical protein
MATLFPRFGTQCKLRFNFKQFKRAAMSPWGAQLFFKTIVHAIWMPLQQGKNTSK